MIKNVVVISDTHFGCKLALMPDEFITDEGTIIKPSELQKKLLLMWNDFWGEFVPRATRNEEFILVHNGDIIDGIHHNSVTQITQNIADQRKMAIQMMRPILDNPKCRAYYHIRGTEAHVGKSGQDEEDIARQLNAIPNAENNYARWELWLRFGDKGLLTHFTHHISTTNSAAYESTAVYKEYIEACVDSARWGYEPPDAVIRSHRHRHFKIEIASKNTNAISVVTPGWQLKTPFVFRGSLGRSSTPQIGGIILREGEEVPIYERAKVWNIQRPEEERL